MDKVFIEGLEVEAVIGIHDWERRIRQALVLDVELGFDNRIPAESDSLDDTLDYEAIGNRLREYMAQSSCGLVERLAEQCANLLFLEFGVAEVRLKLRKLGALKGARSVGVEIVRVREQVGLVKPAAPEPAVVERAAEAPAVVEPVEVEPVEVVESVAVERAVAAPARITEAAAASPVVEAKPADPRAIASRFKARLRVGRETFLSLGSNVEPEQNLRSAVAELRERFGEVQVSPVYRTRSVGFDGPDFLNAVARIDCDTDPFALHRWLHRMEEEHGRDRRDREYIDRPLDIDIVYFGSLVLEVGVLQLPRPELRYAFVLKPMADLAPDFTDPLRDRTMAELWAMHPEHDTPPRQVDLVL